MTTPPLSTLSLALRATNSLVAQAWLSTIPGLSPGMVGQQLPPDSLENGKPAPWVKAGNGFVSLTLVGGNPDPLLPIQRSVFQVDCWAVVPGSGVPPWNTAEVLAETIVRATWDRRTISRPLTITVRNVSYPVASVQGARCITAPRRMWDDAGDMAHVSLDLWLQWMQLNDTIT